MNGTYFQEVREEITRTAVLPDLAEIRRRGRRHQVLTHPAWPVAAIVMVVVGALVGTQALVGQRPALSPAGRWPSLPPAVSGDLRGAEFPLDQLAEYVDSKAASKDLVYGLAQAKNGRRAVVRTLDGGKSWQSWWLPAQIRNVHLITPRGGQNLIVDEATPNQKADTIKRYLSRDGGESWTLISAGEPVDQVPDGWILEYAGMRLGALDLENGVIHPLAHQPVAAIQGMDGTPTGWGGLINAADGSLWFSSPFPERPFPKVSRDRGRTWTWPNATVPVPKRPVVSQSSQNWDTFDGKVGYALRVQTPAQSLADDGENSLYATRDGGVTWQRVAVHPTSAVSDLVVLPDGRILASQTDRMASGPVQLVISADGGRTFTPVPGTSGMSMAWRTVDGVCLTTRLDGAGISQWFASVNGTDWFPVPSLPVIKSSAPATKPAR